MENVVNACIKVTGGRYEWKMEYKGHERRGSGGEGGDRKAPGDMRREWTDGE